jgi:cytochrome c553
MIFRRALLASVFLSLACPASAESIHPLAWAYPVAPEAAGEDEAPSNRAYTVAGSKLHLTQIQIDDFINPVDWRPDDHPPMPKAVAQGKPPGDMPCAACHMPNGHGVHGAVNLAGLPADYIMSQLDAFAQGERGSSVPGMAGVELMIAAARPVERDELHKAADYYASLRFTRWFHVFESSRAPKTRANHYGWLDIAPGTELLRGRIIEVPEDPTRSSIYDPDSGFLAYVPIGSIAAGRQLANGHDPRVPACANCHGEGLRGAAAPPLAGRSPSYLARQLWDIKQGSRHSIAVAPMQEVVAKMTPQDITKLTAYLASLSP